MFGIRSVGDGKEYMRADEFAPDLARLTVCSGPLCAAIRPHCGGFSISLSVVLIGSATITVLLELANKIRAALSTPHSVAGLTETGYRRTSLFNRIRYHLGGMAPGTTAPGMMVGPAGTPYAPGWPYCEPW